MSEITLGSILAHEAHNNWVGRIVDEDRQKIAPWIASLGALFQEKAALCGLPYFDLSRNRESELEKAYHALLGEDA